MVVSRGKQFEALVRKQIQEKVPGASVDRLADQTMGYKGSQNVCDFIVYKYPYEYYIECKTIHGNTLPFTNITETQWKGLLQKSRIKGVFAGILCWWVDKDVTRFLPIQSLTWARKNNYKSIRYDADEWIHIDVPGRKKHVFFSYDFVTFFSQLEEGHYYD